jgi:hypothetical protein
MRRSRPRPLVPPQRLEAVVVRIHDVRVPRAAADEHFAGGERERADPIAEPIRDVVVAPRIAERFRTADRHSTIRERDQRMPEVRIGQSEGRNGRWPSIELRWIARPGRRECASNGLALLCASDAPCGRGEQRSPNPLAIRAAPFHTIGLRANHHQPAVRKQQRLIRAAQGIDWHDMGEPAGGGRHHGEAFRAVSRNHRDRVDQITVKPRTNNHERIRRRLPMRDAGAMSQHAPSNHLARGGGPIGRSTHDQVARSRLREGADNACTIEQYPAAAEGIGQQCGVATKRPQISDRSVFARAIPHPTHGRRRLS